MMTLLLSLIAIINHMMSRITQLSYEGHFNRFGYEMLMIFFCWTSNCLSKIEEIDWVWIEHSTVYVFF